MTFVHPLLLGGLLLVGVPVLLHLIMRQKPKHLLFPAFRFLLERHHTNQRKLRLRHLLLLALRVLLIAAICLALARPRVLSEGLNLVGDQPVAVVLVFDTSPSMEYTSGGRSRLDEARRRSLELLDELPDGSRVAVLDSAELGGEWLPSRALARERITGLRLVPSNQPVTGQLGHAYRLLAGLDQELGQTGEVPPRFLYVFSDRTQACWDSGRLPDLQQLRDRLAPPVRAAFVDVGIDQPVDLAIAALELPRQVIAAHDRVVIRATLRATGQDCENEVLCRIDGERTADRKPVQLRAGQSQVLTFERRGLAPGLHQAEVTLGNPDGLTFANARFATFKVRGARRVLTVTDDPNNALVWKVALETAGAFACEVLTPAQANKLVPEDLVKYQAVCLVDVARPEGEFWEKLASYVGKGGGLAVVPGGDETSTPAYNGDQAQQLLPGRLVRIVQAATGPGATWSETAYRHPVLARFREWRMNENVDFQKVRPAASRYWEVQPLPNNSTVVVTYADQENRPALLERAFDRDQTRGRVLLFTTALDDRHVSPGADRKARWNDYLGLTSFYLVLVQETVGYLAGDTEEIDFNFQTGQTVPVPLPLTPRFPRYTLQGPGLTGSEASVPRVDNQNVLKISQAVAPGNYTLVGGDDQRAAAFSLNVPPEECQLARVPAEQIEALFGPGAVLAVDRSLSLRDALQGHWGQPVELFPWLMILVLLALAVENLLANKFYRREPGEREPAVTG
jgi:hypothetical protein